MQQFFIDDSQIGEDGITITGPDVNHISHVLRMRAGEKVRVSTHSGKNMICAIAKIGQDSVLADILDREAVPTELPAKIYLFQALPKGDRMEYVIQKAVELGVFEIIPVAMKYCVMKLDPKKAENKIRRWQAISESAAKQSKRSLIPSVHSVMTFKDAAAYANAMDLRIVPYEIESGMNGTRCALEKVSNASSIAVFIGPEGGFSEGEIEALRPVSEIISLGKRILRTDTAAITAMSMLMLALEE